MKSFMHILSLTAAIFLSFQLHGQTMYENVKKAESRNDLAAVASLYSEWLKLAPNDIGLIYNTANAYYKNKQYKDAIPLFKRALESANYINDISTWTSLIECYDISGQSDDAIQFIKQQIEKYPNYPVIFSALSFANIKNKNYEDALLASNRSIELVPQNPVAYFFQGMAYGSLKTYRPAIEALKKSIAIYPNFSQAYLFLGRYLIDYNETEEAISTLKKGLTQGENSLLHLMLGLAQFKLGKYADAYTEIDKALAIESKSGTGISIEMVNKYPVIKTIQDNTPAQSAELKPGDIIVDINSKSARKMKADEVMELLSSKKGSSLILTLERNGNSFTKTITCSDIPKTDAAISFAMRRLSADTPTTRVSKR
ncbi:MAG: tetratricopeptide repeat protein [Saprospirales bacterium]|nr:tetratricopeptide repeat protein [Saprospirales bacterium]